MSPYLITLADHHVLFRQGLRRILEQSGEMRVIGEATDGMELLKLLNRSVPDMVVLDISMPVLRGIEAVREIKGLHPRLKALILTMHRDEEYLRQAFSSGADGYLLKEDPDTELFSAIEKIRQGEFYVSPSLSRDPAAYLNNECGEMHDCLTTREREVVKLIAEGKSSAEIAALFCISVRTVSQHRINIRNKLGLKRTADLVKYAISRGYIQMPTSPECTPV